ncbi:MAG: hydrogenase maturation peptidase HycI [Candidatus Thorarchaeota archaeon]|nr:hydrogenase maturation peptidase HycI [Candidatus Thorarchaeota archaeon]
MCPDSIEATLSAFLDEATRVAVLGIGNDLRTDDGVGLFIVEHLGIDNPCALVKNVGSVPEAFTSSLTDFGAERVILVDAADMRKHPGHVELITRERIGGMAISTHGMPLSLLMMYLEQETGAKTVLLGIQPQSIAFGEGLTPPVQVAAENLIKLLERILSHHLEDKTCLGQ